MTKEIFLGQLRCALVEERINNVESLIDYYNEMICDRIEDGMEEEAAVEAMGSIDVIVKELSWDRPIGTLVKEKVARSHNAAKDNGKNLLWIILLIIGSPIWVPIVLTLIIVIGVIYMIPWILILTFFVVLISLGFSAFACLLNSGHSLIKLDLGTALISLGSALVLAPLCTVLVKPVIRLAQATLRIGASMVGFVKRIIF